LANSCNFASERLYGLFSLAEETNTMILSPSDCERTFYRLWRCTPLRLSKGKLVQ
jgi:hypothetical protein